MDDAKLIFDHFPHLTSRQREQIGALGGHYAEWNSKINLISRKDFPHLYLRHVLHALGIAKVIQFVPDTTLLDLGTGGGFPGIPLAILFPHANFHLVDAIGKKVYATAAIAQTLQLDNVKTQHVRAETLTTQYDFVVARAVAPLPLFHTWAKGRWHQRHRNTLRNGILYLKGGDYQEELGATALQHKSFPLHHYFPYSFFITKQLIHLYNKF